MSKPVILLDVDGVLADFVGEVIRIGNELGGSVKREEATQYDVFKYFTPEIAAAVKRAVAAEGFCLSLNPFREAMDGVAHLRDLGNVYAVTSPWSSKTWCYERTSWLRSCFGFRTGEIVHTAAKYLVRGDVLIDDKASHVQEWQVVNPSGLALLMDAPYNRNVTELHRVTSWSAIVQAVTSHVACL